MDTAIQLQPFLPEKNPVSPVMVFPPQTAREVGGFFLRQDRQTGERRVQRGPLVWIPGPREEGKAARPRSAEAVGKSPRQYRRKVQLKHGSAFLFWTPGF